jgi:predicted metal-binding protein
MGHIMPSAVDIEELCELARSKGASGAVAMDAGKVAMDVRVRMKCMVPRCANYGRNLMCPPNVMSYDEFARVLGGYRTAILVQYPIPVDQAFMRSYEGTNLEEFYDNGEYFRRLLKSEIEFIDLLGEVEKQAMGRGYRFATALTGGPCRLCDECVGQGSGGQCRHPFRSRPSMEAMGIDVFLTAQNAGMPFEIPPRDRPVWNGLALID